ncbi:MAG: type I-U CRISPR-associated protein Cas5/Cas6 [Acidobacteria bacterium]|nr:type I-U CRISPR-associated protein Cas5/Cas6 [Acidobacteriota bacterium]
MPLIIEQRFPLGRFNATRWHQNPFEDPFGEWPPSPLRLLRALTARWFQYARETGDSDTGRRDELLRNLARELPSFALPSFTWRGQPLKQYVPTALEDQFKYKKDPNTKKPVLDYKFRQVTKTLTEDQYRVLSPNTRLYWHWEGLDLEDGQKDLLDQLLKRILYFGRAESFSYLRRVSALPPSQELNCHLSAESADGAAPVLAQIPNEELSIPALLSLSDDKELSGKSVPPNTAWFYAKLPDKPVAKPINNSRSRYPTDLNYLQFAVGGTVYPPLEQWVTVVGRFRGGVIRCLSRQLTGDVRAGYHNLTLAQRDAIKLITGKDGHGNLLRGHQQAYFFLWPDEKGLPTRLIGWRKEPFTEVEIEAMLEASRKPIRWGHDLGDWAVRLVPLPFNADLPESLFCPARTWTSATPFVLPAGRHRFRRNGRERVRESPESILIKLLQNRGKPCPKVTRLESKDKEVTWVKPHETRARRLSQEQARTNFVRLGFWLRLEFLEPVSGPLLLGDSCHFGLGAFKVEA